MLEGERVRVDVDVAVCRWSAQLKGSQMTLRNVHFLPGDNTTGWFVKASTVHDEANPLGGFKALTLHGTKSGQLDFNYHIWVSKTGTDIIVSIDRANNTGGPVDVGNVDYIIVPEARLGGTNDQWMTFGVRSSYKLHYKLTDVNNIIDDQMYETCQLARNKRTGGTILMGHLTVKKGHSRFVFTKGDSLESMKMRAYCNYNATMAPGKSFNGELLLVNMSTDGLGALEHMGELMGIANEVGLKQRDPINLDDRGLIACTHCCFIDWMSGSQGDNPDSFIQRHGLDKFYYLNPA